MIIGLTGTIGAGKGTVVEYLLSHHDFVHYSVRNFLNNELGRRNLELTRDNMAMLAEELRKDHGAGYMLEALLTEAEARGGNAIIESIRAVGEVEAMRLKAPHFILFAVDADPRIRYERIVKRNSSTDHISFEKFMEDEARESQHGEKWQYDLPSCIKLSDYLFLNNGNVETLYTEVEEVISKHK